MSELLETEVDQLTIRVFASRREMGDAAGKDVASRIRQLQKQQNIVRMIFAAAPSQNELLAYLAADETIDWSRIDVFHMDEYIGLPYDAPQRFSSFLVEHLFEKVKPRNVYLIEDEDGLDAACVRYTKLLNEAPIDIVCLGIGENGHIAFNDPPVADFDDPKTIKPVTLDDACRQQQVNDGCFPSFDEVPERALTLTIPALLAGKHLYCVVPGKTKRDAVRNVVKGSISTTCPASILRTHDNCIMYTDKDAYQLIIEEDAVR
jgi:glucosamine-6-phosphate deaminase